MFNFLVKNKIKSLCKNNKREKRFLSLDKIHTILIVFEANDYEVADSFFEHLKKMGKQVKAYVYKAKDDKYDYSETPYRIVEQKVDTNRSGAPSKKLLEEFKAQTVDVLIDLTIKENTAFQYLVAASNIPLKVGLKKNKLPIYDLAITNLPKNSDPNKSDCVELCRQILHYLSTIHSV